MENYSVYILRCNDTTLYTGVTTDVEKRVNAHNTKKTGASYTKTRRPVILVYSEGPYTRSDALKREYYIKQLPRDEKLQLIQSKNNI